MGLYKAGDRVDLEVNVEATQVVKGNTYHLREPGAAKEKDLISDQASLTFAYPLKGAPSDCD